MATFVNTQKGFTLIELVMVIVLLGILSYGASGLFSSKSSYAEFIAKEQFIVQALLAQQMALGMSGTASDPLNPDSVSLQISRSVAGDTSFILTKVNAQPLEEKLDSSLSSPLIDGVTLAKGGSVTFTWNNQAQLSDNTHHSISFVGDKTYSICLSASGYVYENTVACQ